MKHYVVTITLHTSIDIEVDAENKESAEEIAYEDLNESEDLRAELLDFNNGDWETSIAEASN